MSANAPPRRRVRVPRRVRPGVRRAQAVGDRLACLVIARLETEWVGIDLHSGTFVRVPGELELGDPVPDGPRLVVGIRVGIDPDPADPARPESVVPAGVPVPTGVAGRRAVRRLLLQLAARERRGATVLGTRGPSIAYVDLDGSEPSLALLAVAGRSLELVGRAPGDAVLGFEWGGTRHLVTVADPTARDLAMTPPHVYSGPRLALALGYRPGFVLVGLGPVESGHARKVVLALV